MTNVPTSNEPKSLYELSWTYARDGKVALDADTGLVVDANPAAEALMGYSRAELIGMHVTMLHPDSEAGGGLVKTRLREGTARWVALFPFTHPA